MSITAAIRRVVWHVVDRVLRMTVSDGFMALGVAMVIAAGILVCWRALH